MAHPMQEHRAHKVEKERVSRIAGCSGGAPKHYARGGSVHSDEAEDRALIRKEVKSEALKHDGKKAGHRADKVARRAKGGHVKKADGGGMSPSNPMFFQGKKYQGLASDLRDRADSAKEDVKNVMDAKSREGRAHGGKVHHGKSGKTNVNVIVAPGGAKPPMPMPGAGMAPPMGAAPPPMPPKPPMMPPPPAAGMGSPPAPGLGGMPPRSQGGRAYKKGGAVSSSEKGYGAKSLADAKGVTGIGDRTPIQHSGNKNDTQNIGRGKPITYATGGAIYSDGAKGKQMAPHLPAGSGSAKARIAKAHMQNKAGHEPWEPGIER